MPTKIVRTKPAAEAEAKRLKKHPLMSGDPVDIEAYVEANLQTLPQMKEAIKVLAKALALK